jgi:hypothetical protein
MSVRVAITNPPELAGGLVRRRGYSDDLRCERAALIISIDRSDHNPVSAVATDQPDGCYERSIASILATVPDKGKPAVSLRRNATGRSCEVADVPPKGLCL